MGDKSSGASDNAKSSDDSPNTPTRRTSTRQRSSCQSQLGAIDSASKKELREREKAERERLRQEKREQAEREKEARRIQREEERRAKEREREEERARKEEERRAREREKEEERARKDEEKRAREREKEEERARKEEERRAREREKEEERVKREEERRAKEEERRKREAERAREEEERQRKLEKQRAIMKAFVVLNKSTEVTASNTVKADSSSRFMQFELKKDQRMAPICRIVSESLSKYKWQNIEDLSLSWREKDQSALDGSRIGLTLFGRPNYLLELRKGQIKPMSYPPTWPIEVPEGLGLLIQDMSRQPFNYGDSGNGGVVWVRAKYLHFAENIRPPYYGTYRSRSNVVAPRRPFAKDFQRFDYDFDSDEEWEDGDGESVSQSDQEEEDEDEESDEDAKFLVPHGYLSDDEKEGAEDPDDDEPVQMKNLRQQLSLAEYEAVHRRGSSKLHAVLIGPIWLQNPLIGITNGFKETSNAVAGDDKENYKTFNESDDGKAPIPIISERERVHRKDALGNYMVYLWPDTTLPVSISIKSSQPQAMERDRKRFPANAIPYLIRLLHKNQLGKAKLQFEFRVFWLSHTWCGEGKPPLERFRHFQDVDTDPESQPPLSNRDLPISKVSVMRKIAEIGAFEEGEWRVRPEVLEANKEAVLSLKGLPPIDRSNLPANLSDPSFKFPPWPYLTDVKATFKRRSMSSQAPLPTPTETSKQSSEEQSAVMNSSASEEASSVPKKRSTLTDFFVSPPASKRPKMESKIEKGVGDP